MITWTLRAYHRRFTHRVVLACDPQQPSVVEHCRRHHANHWRKLNHYARRDGRRICTAVTIYCQRGVYEDLLQNFAADIRQVSRPLDDYHDQLLQQRVELVLRDRPWFGRYGWSVLLQSSRHNPQELRRWVAQSLGTDAGSWMIRGRWCPILYLREEADLTMVRLALAERITGLRKVLLTAQLPTPSL